MKTKKITKSMKYRIKFNEELYNILRDIQYDVWLIKNKSTTMAYDWQQFNFSYNERFGDYLKDKEVLGKTLFADIYNELKGMGKYIASSTYNTAVKEAVDKFNNDRNDIINGRVAVANYRRDGSFPIRATQIKNIEEINRKTFTANLSLLSQEKVKQLRIEFEESNKELNKAELKKELSNIKTQLSVTLISGGGATDIMERIISGEYKLSDSRITQDRKGRYYLSIVYQFTPELTTLDKNKTMGIDIGVNVPAVLAISNDKYYRQFVGDGKEILAFQTQMNNRKRRLQQSRKWAGKGSVGHGTKTRIKPLKKLSGKIARFKDHKNHVWSRYIVDEAVRNNCGTIQMEELENIASDSTFLKTWAYYDLQEKIRYKAEEAGIEVVKINPNYTSQRCNRCGNINKNNRDVRKNGQDLFECTVCNHKTNADLNAAKNISMKDIEKIIKDQIKLQEKTMKHNLKYADL